MKQLLLKTGLFLFLFLSYFAMIAQKEYNDVFDWKVESVDYHPINHVPERNVKQIKYEFKNKNNKVTKTYIKNFNTKGKVTSIYGSKKDSLVPEIKIVYLDETKTGRMGEYKNGKIKFETIIKRDADDRIIGREKKRNRDNKMVQLNTWKYNNEGCLIESARYKKGGKQIKYKWEYERYDSCKLLMTTLYNSKNKIVNQWNYACKNEGEKPEKKKNITQVCRWKKTEDSVLTYVSKAFDEKGKIIKYTGKYTLKDTLILEWTEHNEKDQLLSKEIYDKSVERPILKESYRKGKLHYSNSYSYVNNRISSIKNRYKKKNTSQAIYSYYDNGMLKSITWKKRENSIGSGVTLSYIY